MPSLYLPRGEAKDYSRGKAKDYLELIKILSSKKESWNVDNPRLKKLGLMEQFDKPYIDELHKIVDEFREEHKDCGLYIPKEVYSKDDLILVLHQIGNMTHRDWHFFKSSSPLEERNKIIDKYEIAWQKFQESSESNNSNNNASAYDNSINNRTKRGVTSGDDAMEQSVSDDSGNESNQNNNEPLNAETPNNALLDTIVPVTVMTSLAITTAFTASNIKALYDEKQGNSSIGTAVRIVVQISVPSVVGSVPVGIAVVTGAVTALPVTIAVAATAAGVASICGGITLVATLYYNKFFVAQKLNHLVESFKKIPASDLTLAQKESLSGLINNSLRILKGDTEKGIEKSSKKIKKLNPQILFNLSKIETIISELATHARQSKEAQKCSKYINDILEHSVLFSLLINDMKHIKKTYELLNLIKKNEQANKNSDIQHILAQINRNNLYKIAKYDDLLERFKAEQDYSASTRGKLRAISKAIISFVPEKKEFVPLHNQVIHLGSEINDDYRELKGIIDQLQKHSGKLKSKTSQQQILDIYTAYKPLFYREAIGKNIASLIKTEHKHNADDFENINELSSRL